MTSLNDMGTPETERLHHAHIRFIGSGCEFFRMWIVHVLLTLLTLTLYWPVARARQLSWFYRHTEIHGHVLDFQPPVNSMVWSYASVVVFGAVITLPEYVAPDWAGPLFFVYAAVWPLLWCSALRFRMRRTCWRGIRMNFAGTIQAAYRLAWPLIALAGLYVLLIPWAFARGLASWMWVLGSFAILGTLLFPWLWTRLQRFQHGSYVFMNQRTQTDMPAEGFYALTFQYLMYLPVVVLLVLGVGYGVGWWTGQSPPYNKISLFAVYFYLLVVGQAFFSAKLQNLLWNHTCTERMQFKSQVPVWRYVVLQCQNWFLMLVTGGLFYPFAKVRAVRLRLESVSVVFRGHPAGWMASTTEGGGDAFGDAAQDQVGIDIGI